MKISANNYVSGYILIDKSSYMCMYIIYMYTYKHYICTYTQINKCAHTYISIYAYMYYINVL